MRSSASSAARIALIARLRAPFQPLIAQEISEGRSFLRHQLEKLFDPELQARRGVERTAALAAVDVLCSSETYDLLRHDREFTVEEAAAVMRAAIRKHLA